MPIIILKEMLECNTITAIYFSNVWNHCTHINFLSDLSMTSIIGYVGMKFEQINEHLKNMANSNKCGMTQAWDNTVIHTPQRQFAHIPSNKWMIWIIIQLHLELCKISRDLDSIYGIEMTFKMGCYFILMALYLNDFFHMILIPDYADFTVMNTIISIFWCSHHALKLIVINLVCEKVSGQASSTKNVLNKILYHSMNDMETYENILQLLLHIKQSPLRFCGIGLFQFGYNFLYGVRL
ncbi:uncharacterized protein [Linepithema humile]|uniref:uncharacterized protein n=1 Tax=Linepithema humile TaxID=83485 RepID=UPI00351ED38A